MSKSIDMAEGKPFCLVVKNPGITVGRRLMPASSAAVMASGYILIAFIPGGSCWYWQYRNPYAVWFFRDDYARCIGLYNNAVPGCLGQKMKKRF